MSDNYFKFLLIIFLLSINFNFYSENKSIISYPLGFYPNDILPDKTVYFTFDDGPSDWTDDILNILKKENIKATFFICGKADLKLPLNENHFKKYKNALKQMVTDGHVIGNHTLNHLNLAKQNKKTILYEIDENQKLLNEELGIIAPAMTLFRPPYGLPWETEKKYSENTIENVGDIVSEKGILILWSLHFDSSDSWEWVKGEWSEKGPKVNLNNKNFKNKMSRIYHRLVDNANGKGIIILFHDIHPTTMEILPSIIEKLKQKDYKFETIEKYVKWRWKNSSKELLKKQNKN